MSTLTSMSECAHSGMFIAAVIMFVAVIVVDFVCLTSPGAQFRLSKGPVRLPFFFSFLMGSW